MSDSAKTKKVLDNVYTNAHCSTAGFTVVKDDVKEHSVK